MFTLIWILFIALILILVAISEYNIAKQDEEWMRRIIDGDKPWTLKLVVNRLAAKWVI